MYNMPALDTEIKFSRDQGKPAIPGEGLALEAQTLPDAINQENFGDIVLPKRTVSVHITSNLHTIRSNSCFRAVFYKSTVFFATFNLLHLSSINGILKLLSLSKGKVYGSLEKVYQ